MKNKIVTYLSDSNPVRATLVEQACKVYVETMLKNEANIRANMKNHIIHPDEWMRCVRDLKITLDGGDTRN